VSLFRVSPLNLTRFLVRSNFIPQPPRFLIRGSYPTTFFAARPTTDIFSPHVRFPSPFSRELSDGCFCVFSRDYKWLWVPPPVWFLTVSREVPVFAVRPDKIPLPVSDGKDPGAPLPWQGPGPGTYDFFFFLTLLGLRPQSPFSDVPRLPLLSTPDFFPRLEPVLGGDIHPGCFGARDNFLCSVRETVP